MLFGFKSKIHPLLTKLKTNKIKNSQSFKISQPQIKSYWFLKQDTVFDFELSVHQSWQTGVTNVLQIYGLRMLSYSNAKLIYIFHLAFDSIYEAVILLW